MLRSPLRPAAENIRLDSEEFLFVIPAAEKELKSVESQIMRIRAQRASYRLVFKALENHSEQLESFSEDLRISLVDRMVVYSKEDIRLLLKDGTENKLLLLILVSNKAR